MVDIRELTVVEVKEYSNELTKFMYMVLKENTKENNLQGLAEKYYKDMLMFSENGSAILIGAWDEQRLIGFHWGYEIHNANENRIHSYFNAIEPEYRGQKIGSRFYRKLEEIAVDREIYVVEAMCTYANKAAVDYHLNNGFEIDRLKVVKHLHNREHVENSFKEQERN